MRGRIWNEYEVDYLRKNYANMESKEIAGNLGMNTFAVHNKAHQLGLKKSQTFLQQQGKRVEIMGKKYQFKIATGNKNKKQVSQINFNTK